MVISNKLVWLNVACGGVEYQVPLLQELMAKFPHDKIVHLEVGSAFGGCVEFIAKLLKDRGVVYGYDTFEGHPKDLADKPDSEEAGAMEPWYKMPGFSPEQLTYEYQRKTLDEEGLSNAILVKGRINEHSFDDIEKAHMVMLDLDLVSPTKVAYEALKDKVVKGGYLLMHDVFPPQLLPELNKFYIEEVRRDKGWLVVTEVGWLAILQKT